MGSWKIIIPLLASGQGLLLSMALITAGVKKNKSNLFLGLILLIISLELLNVWGMQVGYHRSKDAIPFWLLGSYLILPPALWLFVQLNTQPGFRLKKSHLILFLPASIEIITELSSFIVHRSTGVSYHLIDNRIWFAFTELLPIFWMIQALIVYGRNLSSLTKRHGKRYSIHMVKLYSFFIVFSVLTSLWFAEGIAQWQLFSITKNLLTVFLFTLGYVGYFQPAFFEMPRHYTSKSAEEVFSIYDDKKELDRITALFEINKIYIKPRLSLEEVANELKLPSRYVSHLIKRYHAANFNTFVNSYRVKEVLKKVGDPNEKYKTLLGIALESGFSSKSAFNQIFKTHTGEIPSSYFKSPE